MAGNVGPVASNTLRLSDYDDVLTLTRSGIAWEYLRRHPDYRRDWRASAREVERQIRLSDGTIVIRVSRRSKRAEAWGLYTFCKSRQKSA